MECDRALSPTSSNSRGIVFSIARRSRLIAIIEGTRSFRDFLSRLEFNCFQSVRIHPNSRLGVSARVGVIRSLYCMGNQFHEHRDRSMTAAFRFYRDIFRTKVGNILVRSFF